MPAKPGPTIVCSDNLKFMAGLPDRSMQLIVTSPPYNIGKPYETKATLSAYLRAQERVIAECARLLHPRGSICWEVGNHVQDGEIVPPQPRYRMRAPEVSWQEMLQETKGAAKCRIW